MIANDFKAISAAMKATDADRAASDAYKTASAIPGVGPVIAPAAAAAAYAAYAAMADFHPAEFIIPKGIADYPAREFLGDPEC